MDKHKKLKQQKLQWYYRNKTKVRIQQATYKRIVICDICGEKYRFTNIHKHVFTESHFKHI